MAYKPTGRKRGRPKGSTGTPAFSRVERAREALVGHAEDYVRLHKQAATIAAQRGNSAPAEWAISHIALVDEQGKEQRIVAPSIDRQVIEGGSKAPTINIGWVIGPAAPQAALPAVVEVKAITEGEESS